MTPTSIKAPTIGIVSQRDDLHAVVVRQELADRYGARCEIIESDAVWRTRQLTWRPDDPMSNRLPTRDGGPVSAAELDLIWWRRIGMSQDLPPNADPAAIDLINNDCRGALMGSMLADFTGRWVSHPLATIAAELKPVQLRSAVAAGFLIPRTLISQDPEAIRRFCSETSGAVIVKPVKGTLKRMLLTRFVDTESLPSDESLAVAPAIYQEYVPGNQHIRANCFGDMIYAVSIRTAELDWRRNLNVPVEEVQLSNALQRRLRVVLGSLGLRMGVVDLKIDPETREPVWLEVNTQGQFLFLQGLCGTDLGRMCANFLMAESAVGARDRARLHTS